MVSLTGKTSDTVICYIHIDIYTYLHIFCIYVNLYRYIYDLFIHLNMTYLAQRKYAQKKEKKR